MDNYGYPMGADTPDAPWNQQDNDEVEVSICICQSLSKGGIQCYTTDYSIGEEGTDWDIDYDEDGNKVSVPYHYKESNDFSETNWHEVIVENNICTPLEIINEFGKLLDKLSKTQMFDNKYISYWKEQCDGWIEEDIDIAQE